MEYTIVTHDGKAHMDELLAAALLTLHMGHDPADIIRKDAREASREVESGERDESLWYLDCGMKYEPSRRLFDHHQDRELECSALLVFNTFFHHLEGTDLHEYIKLVSKVDTKGVMSLDDFHLVSESRDYYSFSQHILLKTFEENPMMVVRLMVAGLEDKIAFEKARQVASLWRKEPGNIAIELIEGIKVLVYLKSPPPELVSALRSEISRVVDENGISATISFDGKIPEAKALYRTDYGHELIDFTRCSPGRTLFCHQGGFLLKFMPVEKDEWKRLITESILK